MTADSFKGSAMRTRAPLRHRNQDDGFKSRVRGPRHSEVITATGQHGDELPDES